MANQTKQIVIESILGGESKYYDFASADEFQDSLGIDPDLSVGRGRPSGHIIPTFAASNGAASTSVFAVTFSSTTPKDTLLYIYGSNGSVYTYNGSTISGLGDLNDGGDSGGNGLAYYDNYVYLARATTVARYGPLDGTPAFTDDYWTGTLGKTALNNTDYPTTTQYNGLEFNHVMHRHNNGKLYFADVVGNQGVLHCISTTKAAVEGDTDNGSTYNAVDFPYGMYPTAITSYGDLIAVALYEKTTATTNIINEKAKIALWDPTNPTTYDLITGDEFPDPYIASLINANGVLYIVSGHPSSNLGVRITRYLGGRSFEQVAYMDNVSLPFPQAFLTYLNKISLGVSKSFNNGLIYPAVVSVGTKLSPVSNKIFTTFGPLGTNTSTGKIFSLARYMNGLQDDGLIALTGDGGGVMGIYRQALPGFIGSEVTKSIWVSQTFRLGQYFKITKVSIPLNQPISLSDTFAVTPSIIVDDGANEYTLQTINTTNYPLIASGLPRPRLRVNLKPDAALGDASFNLKLTFAGTANQSGFDTGVALPIYIEYELIDE